jgi:hypothetical protein
MSTVYFPKIRAGDDYSTLRSEPNLNLPDTYNEWLDFSYQQMREIIVAGDTPCEIEVNPDEFARFCQAGGHARTFDRLLEFVTEKGRGKSY